MNQVDDKGKPHGMWLHGWGENRIKGSYVHGVRVGLWFEGENRNFFLIKAFFGIHGECIWRVNEYENLIRYNNYNIIHEEDK